MPPTDHAALSRRFLDGLAAAVELDTAAFDTPGVTVVAREDRAGSSAAACYRIGEHLLIWADPAVADAFESLAGSTAVDDDALATHATSAGFELVAGAVMRLPTESIEAPEALPAPYRLRHFDEGDPTAFEVLKTFTARCDPDDVEEAALDEIDELSDFDEFAVTVVLDADDEVAAWASATSWDWDEPFDERRFGDVGILVHADHRRRGLARLAVASTAARLSADGVTPLYRHQTDNAGSTATADALGFVQVTELGYWRRG